MLTLVTNETKIIKYQKLLDKTLKAALVSEKIVRLGTPNGTDNVNLNYNKDIWFGTFEQKVWYWNSFGLYQELDFNRTNKILLEINIKTSDLTKHGGGFLIDEKDNILLFHRGNLNRLKIRFLEWYSNKHSLKEIDNGEKVIVIGVIKSEDFVKKLTNYIKDVSSFKELVRKENSHEHVNDDNEIEIESLSDSTINSLLRDTKKTDFEKIERIIFVPKRNRVVVEKAKELANGECQLCGCNAPFENENCEPYLEVHHIKWLSQGGDDCIENAVALCPNCHRKMHILNLEEDVAKLTEIADPSW